ncbi:MAG: cytochrome c3 family protein [Deltaproteobacteria bacterium]|nr:cytochrome c3 family protein [Deltaproteobacteria bacterium]
MHNKLRMTLSALTVMLIGLFAVGAAAKWKDKAPAKPIVIKGCKKKKPPVNFDHPAHVKALKAKKQDCDTCHHNVKNAKPDKNACSECHSKPQKDAKNKDLTTCSDKSKKGNPFHIACIGCHKKMKTSGDKKLPVKCNECHKK